MVHDLNPKNLHIDGLFFYSKSPKSLFSRYFWALSQKWYFSPKSGTSRFSSIRHLNFKKSFRKILWAIFLGENMFTYWHIDILTAVKSWDPFSPKGEGPKTEKSSHSINFPRHGLCTARYWKQFFHLKTFLAKTDKNFQKV